MSHHNTPPGQPYQVGPALVGLAAGLVAAILYLSISTGSPMGLVLFYLAPLPLFIAGFGWGQIATAVTGLVGAVLVALVLGPMPALTFLITLSVPAFLLTRYAYRYRLIEPHPEEGEAQSSEPLIEWYPIGNLILISALIGGILAMATVLLLGATYDTYLAKIDTLITEVLKKVKEAGMMKEAKPEQIAQFKRLVQNLLPASTAILWTLLTLLNMWLAAHVVRLSGLLFRPWPDLTRFELPPLFALLLPVSLVFSFTLPGFSGLMLSGIAGALIVVFLLLGLAVVHVLTQGSPVRGFLLTLTYFAVIIIGWGAVPVIALGLAEPFLDLRKRKIRPET